MIETLQDVRETLIAMLCAELSCSESKLPDGQVHTDYLIRTPKDRRRFSRNRRHRLRRTFLR